MIEAPYEAIAKAIVQLRKELGITQAELAIRVGTNQSTISRAESGRHPVNTRFLKRIADAYGRRIHIEIRE